MKIVGHRGARGLAPENTIASLKKGLEHQADQIEFDVRVTKDNVVILHHDSKLVDLSGQKHRLSDYTYKELLEHKPDLITLNQALDCIRAKATVYIEVKPRQPVVPIKLVLQPYMGGMYSFKNLLLGSKSQATLLELHQAFPAVPKIVIEPWSGVRAIRRAKQVNTTFISMNQRWLWWGFIRSVSRRGWKLYAYTLNDPAKARRWDKYGLYGIVTDYPDLFDKL